MVHTLLLKNGTVCTLGSENPEIIENGAILVEDDTIAQVGKTSDFTESYDEVIDCQGKLVMPGFICAHGHFYGLYSRGMDMKCPPAYGFLDVLEKLWWRLDRALDADSNYYSALAFYVDAIKAGTTTIVDHHASPNAIAGSLDRIADAAKKSGVRSCLCYEVTDRNGIEGADEGIKENVRFINRLLDSPDPLLAASFGLHASFTCGDETLAKCVKEMNALKEKHNDLHVGFHIHLAEGKYDVEHCNKEHGCTVTERLQKSGLLGPYTMVGHGVHITDKEMDILKETQTSLITNPESNMNNAIGIPKIKEMLDKGILVGLGTDGMTYDMIQEYKANYLIHKHNSQDPRVMGAEGFDILTKNNSKLVSKFFSKPVGRLEKGCFADIILVDYNAPTPLAAGSFPWHLMFGMSSSMVNTTIVAGKVLMRDRVLVNLDEKRIMSEARALAPKVWGALPEWKQ